MVRCVVASVAALVGRRLSPLCFCTLLLSLPYVVPVGSSSAETYSVPCTAQDIREIAPRGELVVTDFAVVHSEPICPIERLDIKDTVLIERGQRLWLWFRLEGDLTYLETRASSAEITLAVARESNGPLLEEFISVDTIIQKLARDESLMNNGYFDWRTKAYKTIFVPGTYYFELAQAGARICFMLPDNRKICQLTVKVE